VILSIADSAEVANWTDYQRRFLKLASKAQLTKSSFWKQVITNRDREGRPCYPLELKLFGQIADSKNRDASVRKQILFVQFYLINTARSAPDNENKIWEEVSDL
jgi:hypothetical protein